MIAKIQVKRHGLQMIAIPFDSMGKEIDGQSMLFDCRAMRYVTTVLAQMIGCDVERFRSGWYRPIDNTLSK